MLPLHECVVEPLHVAIEAAAEHLHSAADPDTAEALHFAIEPAGGGAAPTETTCLLII
jgi:hypothetical protein